MKKTTARLFPTFLFEQKVSHLPTERHIMKIICGFKLCGHLNPQIRGGVYRPCIEAIPPPQDAILSFRKKYNPYLDISLDMICTKI